MIVHQALSERPVATALWLSEKTGLTIATVNKSLLHLFDLGIVEEITSQMRNRCYAYSGYMSVMNEGI
jgi:predicted transcriptional regulator